MQEKKTCTVKIFNYLQNNWASIYDYQQNNWASIYDYESLENEITDLRNDGIINETFKIAHPIEEVLNFPQDDVDITSENFDISYFIHNYRRLMKKMTQYLL